MQNKTMNKIITIVILFPFIGGCSAINLLFDDHKVFENARNSEVGKQVTKVLKSSHYYDYWEGNSHYHNFKELEKIKVTGSISEYRFIMGKCEWALVVDVSTNVVREWRYLANEQECKYKKFYEGPF